MLRVAVANKGRPNESSLKLLEESGLKIGSNGRRLLVPTSNSGVQVLFARAMDIPPLVENGIVDLGIAGKDAIAEKGSKVEIVLPLDFGQCIVGLAAKSMELPPQPRIATALPNLARNFCREEGLNATVLEFEGALESFPALGLADAIVDQVETGDSLRDNGLILVRTIMETEIYLVANGIALCDKRSEMDDFAVFLNGVVEARKRVLFKVNAASPEIRDRLLKLIPAMKSPDVLPLAAEGAFSLLAAVPKGNLNDLILRVRCAGGTDILISKPDCIIA